MRTVRLAIAGLLALTALTGCGANAPSTASPARLAPPNALLYLELTVRPQGDQRAAVESALTRAIGHSPNADIQRIVTSLFQHARVSYSRDLQPWLGQHIGLVLTSVSSPPDVGLIAPTNDPAAALAALHRLARHATLQPASYRGVRYETGSNHGRPLALGIVSRAAVAASPPVFQAIIRASAGRGLTGTPGFQTAMRGIAQTSLVRGYADLSAVGSSLRPILGTTGTPGLPAPALSALLGQLKGTVGFSLAARAKAFVFNVRSSSAHPSQAADVSGLPGQSWLALAADTSSQRTMSLLDALRRDPAFAAALSRFHSRTGLDLLRDVLPGLGRVELSIGGTSPLTLGAGILATPSNPAAGRRLLAGIHRVASRSSSLEVQGSYRGFSITRRGSLLPRVFVAEEGSRIVGTLDETVAELVNPSQPLSYTPRFTTARRQLPAGSRVSAFLDFRALTQLLDELPNFRTNQKDARALAALRRFDYLITGSDPATGQSRLVLALR